MQTLQPYYNLNLSTSRSFAVPVTPKFGRALYPWERPGYTETVKDALTLLGKKNLTLIAHGSSFPAYPDEDTGFGSPMSRGAKRLIRFLHGLGFNSVQLGPAGITKAIDASPYTGTSFSNNTLFIDLKPLVNDAKWGGILSPQTYKRILENNPKTDTDRTAYSYIHKEQALALKEAYANFMDKLAKQDPVIQTLNTKFEAFKKESHEWLDRDALYEALSQYHGSDYFPNWDKANADLDKHLFCPRTPEETKAAEIRIAEVGANYKDVIENYKFSQFIAEEQIKSIGEYAKAKGIKYFADRQVAFTDRDLWAYQPVFMKDYYMGVPPDYYSKEGQAWGFPMMDPEKITNPDGSLGEGGKLLYNMFRKMFKENPGGVRIDHFVGLADPWVYPKDGKPTVAGGGARLYSSPEHPVLKKYAVITKDNLNMEVSPDNEERVKDLTPQQIERYAKIIKIILQAAKDEGMDKNALICEDLGTLTTPVREIFKTYGFSGLRVTQFVNPKEEDNIYRGKNVGKQHWIMIGSHDCDPLIRWWEKIKRESSLKDNAMMLVEDIYDNPVNKEKLAENVIKQPELFRKLKLAELFTSPAENIQLMFTDLFGMKETYNIPGTIGDNNWSLRIPTAFKRYYQKQLHQREALNLPDVLLTALKTRGLDKANQPLVQKLEKYQRQLQRSSWLETLVNKIKAPFRAKSTV